MPTYLYYLTDLETGPPAAEHASFQSAMDATSFPQGGPPTYVKTTYELAKESGPGTPYVTRFGLTKLIQPEFYGPWVWFTDEGGQGGIGFTQHANEAALRAYMAVRDTYWQSH